MSRSGRDDDRNHCRGHVREPVNYLDLAEQSRTLDSYKRKLAKRNVTPETSNQWQKAMTAWQAVEAARQQARVVV